MAGLRGQWSVIDNGLMPGILSGLRVVEVSTFVAAPLGGMTLAQLGAEVVRVDPLGGAPDHTRWPLAAVRHQPLLGRAEQGEAFDRGRPALGRRAGAGDQLVAERPARAAASC